MLSASKIDYFTFSNVRVLTLGILLWFFWVFAIPNARAEAVEGLYEAEVLVSSQSARERDKAIRTGLGQVVVRVSGTTAALGNSRIISAQKSPNQYLSAFSYASTDQVMVKGGKEQEASLLRLKFSNQAVDQLIRLSDLPLWPADRPSVLVWLVVDDFSKGRKLVTPADHAEVFEQLNKSAVERGIPLVTPVFDMEDRLVLSVNSLWNFDDEKILDASERYNADTILVGRYSQSSRGQWLGTWMIMHRQRNQVLDNTSGELNQLIASGIGQTADYLAGLYAIDPRATNDEGVYMVVSKVGDFGAYTRVLSYLEGLPMVRQAQVIHVGRSVVTILLNTEGDRSLLLDALQRDGKIQSISSLGSEVVLPQWQLGPPGSMANPLEYVWMLPPE